MLQLKLAPGMTDAGRLKDLDDVTALIKANSLTRNFSHLLLHPSVREQYTAQSQWEAAQR